MEDLGSMICGDCSFSEDGGKPFCYNLKLLKDPSSCIRHVLVICLDVFLIIMLSFIMILKSSSRPFRSLVRYSNLQLVSAITNGFIGILHLSLGIWVLEKLRKTHKVFPLDGWLLDLFHGFIWLSVGLTVNLHVRQLSRAWLWMFSVLIFLVSGILCALSMSYAIGSSKLCLEAAIDVLSFPGATLLLLCTYKACRSEDIDREIAGFFSKSWFWWLNPFMKRGQEKTLLDEDIPELRETDRAESCYLSFVEQLNKQSQHELSSHSSVLWTITMCHRREIVITGLFALLKVLTLSSGPLLLNEFILVAEGKKSFKYEGFVLAMSLFFLKIIESLSQRQWYFRSRLVGMKVRSLLTAAIYKKILRLSNSAKLVHSSGEIMNYMTVDVRNQILTKLQK